MANENNRFLYTIDKYDSSLIKYEVNADIKLYDNNRYGTSNAYHVLINDKDKAYLKTSKNKYEDDIDVSISLFGTLFDIDITKIYRMKDNKGGMGILSYDIKNNPDFNYISLKEAYNSYYSKYKRGQIRNLKWITELLSLPKGDKDNPLTREDHIKIVIDMGINILKDEFNISDDKINVLKKEYLKILVFDYFTNQTDRSQGNINLIIDKDNISFAPLYDNGCVYNEAIGEGNIVLLDYVCSRESFIRAIFKYYFHDIKDNLELYLDKNNYINKINFILRNNLSEYNYNWYYKIVCSNADKIIELYNQYKDIKEKVDEKREIVDLRLQYGYVRTFLLLLSSLLILLGIIILVNIFV